VRPLGRREAETQLFVGTGPGTYRSGRTRATLCSMRTWLRLTLLLALALVVGCGGSDETPGRRRRPEPARRAQPAPADQRGERHGRRPGHVRQRAAGRRRGRSSCAWRARCATTARQAPQPRLERHVHGVQRQVHEPRRVPRHQRVRAARRRGLSRSERTPSPARSIRRARPSSTAGPAWRRSASTPLKAVRDLEEKGSGQVAGVKVHALLGDRRPRGALLPARAPVPRPAQPGGAPTVITPKQRAELKSMFSAPSFELGRGGRPHGAPDPHRRSLPDACRQPQGGRRHHWGDAVLRGDLRAGEEHAPQIVPPAKAERRSPTSAPRCSKSS
jgi:hypothetical protein